MKITEAGGVTSTVNINLTSVNSGGSIASGTRIYLTNNITEFNSFYGITPLKKTIAIPGLSNLDGNDALELIFDFNDDFPGNIVDVFGNTSIASANDRSVYWAYEDGWAYRNSNTLANQGTFDSTANWNYDNWAFRPINSIFGRFMLVSMLACVAKCKMFLFCEFSLKFNQEASVFLNSCVWDKCF